MTKFNYYYSADIFLLLSCIHFLIYALYKNNYRLNYLLLLFFSICWMNPIILVSSVQYSIFTATSLQFLIIPIYLLLSIILNLKANIKLSLLYVLLVSIVFYEASSWYSFNIGLRICYILLVITFAIATEKKNSKEKF